MNPISISYLVPIQINDQYKKLYSSIKKIGTLIEEDINMFIAEQNEVDLVELDEDQFEQQTEYLESRKEIVYGVAQTLFSSLFISIYSNFEFHFSAIIKEVEISTGHRIKSKDLRKDGSTIDNYLKFLKLVHQIEFGSYDSELKLIRNLTFIRNLIVHAKGKFPKENKKGKIQAINFIREMEGAEISNDFIIINSESFILKILSHNRDFLLKIVNTLNGH